MSTRYISHFHPPRTDPSTARAAILDALSQNVELVHEYYASHPSDVSVYIGSSGIATMDNYLSELSLPELPSHLFTGSNRYLHPALSRSSSKALAHPRDASKTGFLASSIGLGTLILLRALQPPSEQRQSDTETQTQKTLSDAVPTSLELLNAALQLALAPEHTATDDGCEVLYGRAGLLYALLRLRSTLDRNSSARPPINAAVQTLVTNPVLTQLVDVIIQRGKNGSAAYAAELASAGVRVTASPLMWSWHGKRYLGGAHGVVGILQMILSSPADCITMHIPILLDTVDWLLECKGGHRNWPSVAPTSSTTHRSDLLHWCHGAPAFLILFSTLLRLSADPSHPLTLPPILHEKLIKSMQIGADLVYRKGLLRKGVGLCHGVAGSVYALLAVSEILDPSGDFDQTDSYLLRATELARLATTYQSLTNSGEMFTPDHPWSLYEGVAGMCCAWGTILHKLGAESSESNKTRMPAYTDIG